MTVNASRIRMPLSLHDSPGIDGRHYGSGDIGNADQVSTSILSGRDDIFSQGTEEIHPL